MLLKTGCQRMTNQNFLSKTKTIQLFLMKYNFSEQDKVFLSIRTHKFLNEFSRTQILKLNDSLELYNSTVW